MGISNLLQVTAEPLEDATIVRATGEIDVATVELVRRQLDTAREETATVLLDLSGVTFIDSTGLQLLLDTSHSSAVGEWTFLIVGLSRVVRRLIEVSGTADLLMIADPSAEHVLS